MDRFRCLLKFVPYRKRVFRKAVSVAASRRYDGARGFVTPFRPVNRPFWAGSQWVQATGMAMDDSEPSSRLPSVRRCGPRRVGAQQEIDIRWQGPNVDSGTR
jgi:hypothetical protein